MSLHQTYKILWTYSSQCNVLNVFAFRVLCVEKQFFMPVSKFGFFYFYLVRCEDTSWWYKQRCWWSADTIWQLDNVHNVWTQLDLNKWLKTAKASEASLATSLPPGTVTRNLLRICSTACCQLGNKKVAFKRHNIFRVVEFRDPKTFVKDWFVSPFWQMGHLGALWLTPFL